MERSRRELSINMVLDKGILKNNQITLFPCFTFMYTVNTNPCLRYEAKTGEERNLVVFHDILMNNHINGELSTISFH